MEILHLVQYIFIHMYMHTNRRRIQTQTNWTFDVDYRQITTEFVPYFTSFTNWHVVPCKTKIELELFFYKKQMSPPFLLSEISKCP